MAYNQEAFDKLIQSLNDGTFTGDELNLSGHHINDADVARLMLAINTNTQAQRGLPSIFEKLVYINLSNNQLTTAPDVTKCVNLQVLNLNKNQLTTPPDVSKCVNLQALCIDNNQLISPPNVTKCVKLKRVDLYHNQLTTPPDVTNCVKLECLNLCSNQLATPPDVTKCINLEWLNLCGNRLTTPPDVTNCVKLQELDLACNQLTSPPDVTKCVNLQGLYLAYNQLTSPPDVTKCINLLYLSLDNNQLTTPPDVTNCVKFQSLDVLGNQLTTIARLMLRKFKAMLPHSSFFTELELIDEANVSFTAELLNQHFAAVIDNWNKNFNEIKDSKQSKDNAYNAALALKGLSLQSTTDLQDVMPNVLGHLQPRPNKSLSLIVEQELTMLRDVFKNDQQAVTVLQEYAKNIARDDKGMIKNKTLQDAEKSYKDFIPSRAKEAMAQVNKNYDKMMNIAIKSFLSENGFSPEDLAKPNAEGMTAIELAKQQKRNELALALEKFKAEAAAAEAQAHAEFEAWANAGAKYVPSEKPIPPSPPKPNKTSKF